MTETAHTGIVAALLAFHAEAGDLDLAKNRSGHTNEYLDLDKSMEQIRPLLAKHGLFARHYTGWAEGIGWYAGTVIEHASGEDRESGPFPLVPTKGDMQGHGAALTYARRYTLMEALALVADNDDDGAAPRRQRRGAQPTGKITAAQRNELMAAVREAKIPTDRASEIIKEVGGVEKSTDIPAEKFAEVLKAIRKAN